MTLKEFKSGIIITSIVCLCTGLFSMAHYMGWLAQDSSLLGTIARGIYGPDVRQEMERLRHVKEVTPDKEQTVYTLQRYGVFSWNEHIESIFRNR